MRNKITAVLMAGFFLTLVVSALNINIHRPNILVLHSYDTSYIWTRDLNAGLKRGLDGQSWIQTRYHYMNTKKKSDPGHLRRASIAARKAIDDGKPDVIIAFDDYAQQLAGSYYVNHPDIKIVFAAVNGGVETYNYIGADNVTGIYERKPVAAIKETITLLSKAIGKDIDGGDQVRIALLGDTTLSAKRDEDYVGSYQWAPLVYTGAFTIADFEQWKTTVFGLATKVDFIMVGGYRKLKRLPDSGPKEEFVPPGGSDAVDREEFARAGYRDKYIQYRRRRNDVCRRVAFRAGKHRCKHGAAYSRRRCRPQQNTLCDIPAIRGGISALGAGQTQASDSENLRGLRESHG